MTSAVSNSCTREGTGKGRDLAARHGRPGCEGAMSARVHGLSGADPGAAIPFAPSATSRYGAPAAR
jgi:hypothetical protein